MTEPASAESEVIRALATVTLDARALEELGPQTLDRLADLVEKRLAQRRAAGEAPLLSVAQAAQVAGVHPETVRRAIRSGALRAAGYAGKRPRLRREEVERWLHTHEPPSPGTSAARLPAASVPRRLRSGRRRVLTEAVAAAMADRGRS